MGMARKAKVKGLDKAINELFEDYEGALMKAMKYASKIAKKDIQEKAVYCLEQYYESFQPGKGEPNIYSRTENLMNSFVPYMRIVKSKEKRVIGTMVGMGYWAFMLDNVYSGSKNWTPVDGEWVLENYLKGIHPTTDGSTFPGAPYTPVFDSISPETKMEEFLSDYQKTFDNNVLFSFAKQL